MLMPIVGEPAVATRLPRPRAFGTVGVVLAVVLSSLLVPSTVVLPAVSRMAADLAQLPRVLAYRAGQTDTSVRLAAAGAELLVTTTADELNTDGDCSLREALRAANADIAVDGCGAGRGADILRLPAGIYTLTRPGGDEDAAATGDLDITAPLTVSGAGPATTIVDANALDRLLEVFDVAVTLSGLTLRNGLLADDTSSGQASGIQSSGMLTLTNSAVTGNRIASVAVEAYTVAGISNSGALTMTRSTVSGNTAPYDGGSIGGIYNRGSLTVTDSSIDDNFGGLGGIRNEGTLSVTSSALRRNEAGAGGGIFNATSGTLTLSDSTISGNGGTDPIGGQGGGILNFGSATITQSTISGNSVRNGGGGIANYGVLYIANSTISDNQGRDAGAGIDNAGGTLVIANSTITANRAVFVGGAGLSGTATVANSIIAGNQDGDPGDCVGTLTSLGHNLIGNTQDCVLLGDTTGNLLNTDPQLGPLHANGAAPPTYALLPTSPAVDAGAPYLPGSDDGACTAADQRGIARPQDGNHDGRARCDIGAYELVLPLSAYALNDRNELLQFDPARPERIIARTRVMGLPARERLVGIEIRPSTGELYAVGAASRLYRLDPRSGRATALGSGAFTPLLDGRVFGLDVNPNTDELHTVSDTGQHLRLDLDTGVVLGVDPVLRYVYHDAGAGRVPALDGAAFTAADVPMLYLLDSARDALVHASGRELFTIATLSTPIEPLVGFEIGPQGIPYAVLRAADGIAGAVLATIDVRTGRLAVIGRIGQGELLRGLAIATPR